MINLRPETTNIYVFFVYEGLFLLQDSVQLTSKLQACRPHLASSCPLELK